jgi:Rrf2 family protein
MRITQEADYALRIILLLSNSESVVSAKTISDNVSVPLRFTLKILSKLVGGGLVQSYKGAKGGYELKRPAGEISLLDVIEAIDGKIAINRCLEFGTRRVCL